MTILTALRRVLEQAPPGIPAEAVPSLLTSVLGGLLVSAVVVLLPARRDVYY